MLVCAYGRLIGSCYHRSRSSPARCTVLWRSTCGSKRERGIDRRRACGAHLAGRVARRARVSRARLARSALVAKAAQVAPMLACPIAAPVPPLGDAACLAPRRGMAEVTPARGDMAVRMRPMPRIAAVGPGAPLAMTPLRVMTVTVVAAWLGNLDLGGAVQHDGGAEGGPGVSLGASRQRRCEYRGRSQNLAKHRFLRGRAYRADFGGAHLTLA